MGTTSLLEGPVGRRLLRFVLPILAGNILQQLYNSIDAMIIGRYVGETALGAIGASQPIANIVLALVIGLGIGMEILLGVFIGCRDERLAKQVVDTMFTAVMVLAVLMAAVGYAATPAMLRAMRTQPEHMELATVYLRIIFLGLPGITGYNTMTGAIRASGNSKVPLLFLAICTALNLVLDLLAVKGLGLGVAGAAWATAAAQLLSFLMALYYANRQPGGIHYDPRKLDFSWSMLGRGFGCALPASVQQCATSVGTLLLQTVVNGLGASAVTAYTIGCRIDSFAAAPIINLGQALTIFTSQNLGAGQKERVREGKRYCLLWAYCIGGALLLLLWGCGDGMARFFGATGETVDMAWDYVRTLSVGYFIAGYFTVVEGLIRGTGNTVVPMISTIGGYWLFRLPAAILLRQPLGYRGVWLSVLIGWTFSFILDLIYTHTGHFRRLLNGEKWEKMGVKDHG